MSKCGEFNPAQFDIVVLAWIKDCIEGGYFSIAQDTLNIYSPKYGTLSLTATNGAILIFEEKTNTQAICRMSYPVEMVNMILVAVCRSAGLVEAVCS